MPLGVPRRFSRETHNDYDALSTCHRPEDCALYFARAPFLYLYKSTSLLASAETIAACIARLSVKLSKPNWHDL